jgi:hypothetical protein
MEVVLSSEAEPQVSVVIASLVGAPFDECLSSREGQVRRCGAESLVVACGTSEYARRIAQKFPWIRVIHHDELRARGLAEANGEIVALIEDHGIATPDWIARRAEAHHYPAAAVGGAIENGIDRPLNWAVYFCDFLCYQNPLPEGETFTISDANLAYKCTALESIRTVWQEVFRESSVNDAMRARGEKLVLAPLAVVSQHRQGLRLRAALQERYVWGGSYAATGAKLAGTRCRLFWAVFAPALPLLMLARMILMAWGTRRTLGAFAEALPLIAALSLSWLCGEFIGCLTGRPHSGGETAEALVRGSGGAS